MSKMMIGRIEDILTVLLLSLFVFSSGFILSCGDFWSFADELKDNVKAEITKLFYNHLYGIDKEGRLYFLLSENAHSKFLKEGLSLEIFFIVLMNSIFNVLFQPVFLCPFTPQVLLNAVALPFFIYGAVKYFKKIHIIILSFFLLSFYMAARGGAVIEVLIRHTMLCELIYLMVSSAGFTGWITKKSF